MYEEYFGTEWESLSVDEASRRAYALGVCESLGEPHPQELDRIKREISRSYERSIVELAYDEGRNRARQLKRDTEDAESVWTALVEAEPITTGFGDPRDSGVPEAITRAKFLSRTRDDLERVKFPKVLRERQG